MTTENRSVMAFNLSYLFDRVELMKEGMTQLLGWLERGELKMPTITPYRMEDVAAAHRDLEAGRTVGKLVLLP
jgi:NADPH:quinone reductase-like Zn-dependent oxidoreductase